MGLIERIGSDFAYLTGVLGAVSKVTKVAKSPNRTFPQVARELAGTYGDKPALISERETLTYRQLDRRADQYARWAMAHGVAKGDVVALMMPNRPEYLAVWLGITRAGGVVALLNTNLSGSPLAHCVNIVAAKHIIVDAALIEGFSTAEPYLVAGPEFWCHGAAPEGYERLDTRIDALPDTPIAAGELPTLTIEDRCLYVYTSGTTGLPKAANINHYRVQSIMFGFNGAMRVKPDDPSTCASDVSHVRRRARPVRRAHGGRERDHPRALLRLAVLGRHRAARLHDLHLYRRTLPLPPEQLAQSAGDPAQDPHRLRQRAPSGHLGGFSAPLPHPENPRMVRGDGRQLRVHQLRRQGRRGRTRPELTEEQVPGRDRALRHRQRRGGARPRRLLYQVRSGRSR
jgi:hypothetical protein